MPAEAVSCWRNIAITLGGPDLGEQTAQAWCYGLICNNSDYNSNALPWLTELF